MIIQPIEFLRGNYNYKLYLGINEEGNSVDYIDRIQADEETGYPVRYFPCSTFIQRKLEDGKGAVEYIETVYIKTLLDSFGKPMAKSNEILTFRTNKEDIKFFIAGLGMPIMKSNNNGFFRAKMGFNDLRIFNSINGTVLTYTEEQLNLPPTFTYYDSDITNP